MKKLVPLSIATALLSCVTSHVLAHTVSNALGSAATSVDLLQSTCSKNSAGATGKFIVRVKATKATPLVSAQAFKGKSATNTTDVKGGDASYSPDGVINGGGDGVYTILVNKAGAGANTYVLETHCQTAAGTHTGQAEPVVLQNQ